MLMAHRIFTASAISMLPLGLSYAHAEDDFKTMQQMIPFYRGELAREIGIDGAPIDFLVHWLGVRDHVQEKL